MLRGKLLCKAGHSEFLYSMLTLIIQLHSVCNFQKKPSMPRSLNQIKIPTLVHRLDFVFYFQFIILFINQLACVKVVASVMTNGTFTKRASVFASKVFPVLHTITQLEGQVNFLKVLLT